LTHRFAKHWRSLLISALSIGTVVILACASGDYSGQEGSMFTPYLVKNKNYVPFFRTQESPFYSGYDDLSADTIKQLNLNDWQRYFGKAPGRATLAYWLYTAPLRQIDSMIFVLKGQAGGLTNQSRIHSLVNVQPKQKATAFLYFVGFAKRNERLMPKAREYWEDAAEPPPVDVFEKQLRGGLNFLKQTADVFLRERYAFQILRLYYHAGQCEEAVRFYNSNFVSVQSAANIKWRALGYKAAALYKLQRFAEANVLYARMFDGFKPYKQSAMYSFHPLDGADWQANLLLAKTPREKEVLWAMKGYYTNATGAMREILRLNPKSDLFDLLLVRAINIEEEAFSDYFGDRPADSLARTADMKQLLAAASDKNQGERPVITHMGAAYYHYLKRDFARGDVFLKRAVPLLNNNGFVDAQFHIVSLMGNLMRLGKLTPDIEKLLLPDLKVVLYSNAYEAMGLRPYAAIENARGILHRFCLANQEFEKAELILPGQQWDYFTSDTHIQKMIDYYRKPEKSEFERLFFSKARNSETDYVDLLAVRFTQQGRLEEALKLLEILPSTDDLPGDPFLIHIKDCHDCDHAAPQAIKYSSKDMVKRMVALKKQAQQTAQGRAENYFLLANAFYNITYYGNARAFNSSPVYGGFYNYPAKNEKGESADLALNYYLLAKECSNDKEFRAKCAFMISKCELNRFYADANTPFEGDFKAGAYFDTLRSNYANTVYYQEILKECGYFRTYLAKQK